MSLSAGRLRHQISFQSPPSTSDGAGGREGAWTTFATCRAEVLPTGGREALLTGAQAGVQGWKITVRYRRDIDTTHRVLFDGKTLNIRSVADPAGDRVALLIFAESGVMV